MARSTSSVGCHAPHDRAPRVADVLLERGHELDRRASGGQRECEAPYDAARTRLLLAEVLHTRGNASDAALEAQAARTQFERLGAKPDLQRATRVLETIGAGAS